VIYSTACPLGEECLMAIARHDLPIVGLLYEAWLICLRVMLLQSRTAEPCSGPGPLKCNECMYSHYDGSHMRAPRSSFHDGSRSWAPIPPIGNVGGIPESIRHNVNGLLHESQRGRPETVQRWRPPIGRCSVSPRPDGPRGRCEGR
jgi:hypothetical protein